MIKNNKGVTLVALSITIIVMLIIASVTYVSGRDLLDSTKIRSYITTMYLVKGEVDNMNESYEFDGSETHLKGSKLNKSYDYSGTGATTQEMLKQIYMDEIFKDVADVSIREQNAMNEVNNGIWYILTEADLKQMGIENDMLDNGNVFIVNYKTGFIVYSKGYTNKGITTYSLDGLLNLD